MGDNVEYFFPQVEWSVQSLEVKSYREFGLSWKSIKSKNIYGIQKLMINLMAMFTSESHCYLKSKTREVQCLWKLIYLESKIIDLVKEILCT